MHSAILLSAIAFVAITDAASTKNRDFVKVLGTRDGNCAPQAPGSGPTITSPDDSSTSFLNNQALKDTANSAQIPQGYNSAFTNLQASTSTSGYLGYEFLTSYDPIKCANYCDQLADCIAFNIHFERDPSLDPNAIDCPNPASLTNIKCVRWGSQVSENSATNAGQMQDSFQIVIAGSNGYNKDAPPASQAGFAGPVKLGGAIAAPNDPVTSKNTYMGYETFSFSQFQTYDDAVSACTAVCTGRIACTAIYPRPSPHSHPPCQKLCICNQLIVYVLSKNNQPQSIYCSMFSEEWAPEYATNYGVSRGSDFYGISQAYAYTNASYSAQYGPICDIVGCPLGSYTGGNCGGFGEGHC